jgi:hypothetical protein
MLVRITDNVRDVPFENGATVPSEAVLAPTLTEIL